jgi:hypothetical protein
MHTHKNFSAANFSPKTMDVHHPYAGLLADQKGAELIASTFRSGHGNPMPRRSTKLAPLGTELVPRLIKLLPCLACQRNERAIEGIAAVYLATLHGERPPLPDGRTFRFLPRSCCKQVRAIDPESLVA